jgi:F-type H+-transporting ATPase subunit b
MEDTLRQLGGLVLGAIPTIVLFVALYVAYRFLVHHPLERVLDERRSRTEGAAERARADVAAAEARISEYEQRLREARLAIFRAQEARRQQALQARAAALAEARQMAQAQVHAARAGLEQDMSGARSGLQAEAERLANEIVRIILKPAALAQVPGGGE